MSLKKRASQSKKAKPSPKRKQAKKAESKKGGFAQAVVTEIKKKTKCDNDSVSLLSSGVALSDVKEWIPTGFPALDSIFGGGWPVGRASEIAGNEGCGKSALTHMAIKQCQMMGGEPMIIDFEHSLDRAKMKQLGIDEDRLIYSDPLDVEEAWDEVWTALDYVEKHPPDAPFLIVWDSVAGTVARSERTEKSHADRHVASRAGSMDKGARKMFRRIAKVRAHMMWVNQERVVFGSKSFFQEKTTPGGAQLKYAASLRLTMWRKNIKYSVGDQEEVVGYKSYVRTNKCRLAPPHRKAYFVLDFIHGPNPEMTMFHYLMDARRIKAGGSGTYVSTWSKKKFKRRDWLQMLSDPKFRAGAVAAYEEAVAEATKFTGSGNAAKTAE